MSRKTRFKVFQAIIALLVFIYSLLIFIQHSPEEEGVAIFSPTEKVILTTCEVCLYIIQVMVMVFGLITFVRIIKLSNSQPFCTSGECLENQKCEECATLVHVLNSRMPVVIFAFTFNGIIYVGNFSLYTAQRVINILDNSSDSKFNINPAIQITQLVLMFVFYCSILVAIIKAQKKRFGSKDKKETSQVVTNVDDGFQKIDEDSYVGSGLVNQQNGPRLSSSVAVQLTEDEESDDSPDNSSSDEASSQVTKDRLQALLRLTTERGDDIDYRRQSHREKMASEHHAPRKKMFDSLDEEEEEEKRQFD